MLHHPFPQSVLRFAAILFACLSPSLAGGKDDKPLLRFVCASSLEEDQEVILASRDADGTWKELETTKLRKSLITDWFPAQPGELHLAVREDAGLKSLCIFTCPKGSRRTLVALTANEKDKVYEAHAIDPKQAQFESGVLSD